MPSQHSLSENGAPFLRCTVVLPVGKPLTSQYRPTEPPRSFLLPLCRQRRYHPRHQRRRLRRPGRRHSLHKRLFNQYTVRPESFSHLRPSRPLRRRLRRRRQSAEGTPRDHVQNVSVPARETHHPQGVRTSPVYAAVLEAILHVPGASCVDGD